MPKSETHWYYKPLTYNFCLLPLFFCISYPDIDDEYIEDYEEWKKSPEYTQKPLDVPSIAKMERIEIDKEKTELEKEVVLFGLPYDEV